MRAALRSIFKQSGPGWSRGGPHGKEKDAARAGGERKGCGSKKRGRWRWGLRKGEEKRGKERRQEKGGIVKREGKVRTIKKHIC